MSNLGGAGKQSIKIGRLTIHMRGVPEDVGRDAVAGLGEALLSAIEVRVRGAHRKAAAAVSEIDCGAVSPVPRTAHQIQEAIVNAAAASVTARLVGRGA